MTVYWGSSPVASTTANITCYASRGHPPATLSWYKNDVALDTSNAVYTGTTDSSGKSQCVCVCVCVWCVTAQHNAVCSQVTD